MQRFLVWEHSGCCKTVIYHLNQEAQVGQRREFLYGGMHVCPSSYAVVRLVQQEQDLDHRDPWRPPGSIDHPWSGTVVVVVAGVAGIVAGAGWESNSLLSRLAGIPSRDLVRLLDGISVLFVWGLSRLVLPMASSPAIQSERTP